MNKNILALVFLTFVISLLPLGAQEVEAVWDRIYRSSTNDDQRLAVMAQILELKSRSFGPLLQESLLDLITRRIETGTPNEVSIKVTLSKKIIQVLGDIKMLEAAPEVYKVFEEVTDPILRGEALLTLGKMRAVEYAPALARQLTILNFPPEASIARRGEILAFALVQCLELMKSAEAYEPVFFASIGWYSTRSRVREIAKNALTTMVDDPTESILRIINGNLDISPMISALEAAEASKAPQSNKAQVAQRTLAKALSLKAQNNSQRQFLSNLKIQTLKMLVINQDKSSQTAELLKQNFVEGYNENSDEGELLNTITALGSNGTETAVAFLSERLLSYNAREKNRLNTARDTRIVREIIAAMGRAKSPLAKPALMEMQFSGYSGDTVRQARAVLETLN